MLLDCLLHRMKFDLHNTTRNIIKDWEWEFDTFFGSAGVKCLSLPHLKQLILLFYFFPPSLHPFRWFPFCWLVLLFSVKASSVPIPFMKNLVYLYLVTTPPNETSGWLNRLLDRCGYPLAKWHLCFTRTLSVKNKWRCRREEFEICVISIYIKEYMKILFIGFNK